MNVNWSLQEGSIARTDLFHCVIVFFCVLWFMQKKEIVVWKVYILNGISPVGAVL